jgi:hypothetical protein
MNSWLDAIPEAQRDVAHSAVVAAFGSDTVLTFRRVLGGVSGALTYRIEVNGKPYLLRLQTRRSPLRNPHQYTCMNIAADAGIAPQLRYTNDLAGVAILDFVAQRPLHDYPGGAPGLAAAVGRLGAQLQATPSFPDLGDYRVFLDRMLGYIRRAFTPGLLDPHVELFERIRAAYPWNAAKHVSSHNDPNPGNILFDGKRLWLIDWETSYRNDPMTDVAILTENFAQTPELEEALLRSWLGRQPDQALKARLALMRRLTRLYYAGLLLATSLTSPESEPLSDLTAPTPAELQTLITAGQLKMGSVESKKLLGKMMLAGFLDGAQTRSFEKALEAARDA